MNLFQKRRRCKPARPSSISGFLAQLFQRRQAIRTTRGVEKMTLRKFVIGVSAVGALTALVTGVAISAQDKYTVKVPNGLGFAEFKGYETWQVISISQNGPLMAVILGNP